MVRVQGGSEFQWTYDSQKKALHVEAGGRSVRQFEVRIVLADQSVMEQDKEPQLFTLLQRAQIEYWLKDRVYNAVTHGRDTAATLSELTEMQVGPALYGAVMELLTMIFDAITTLPVPAVPAPILSILLWSFPTFWIDTPAPYFCFRYSV